MLKKGCAICLSILLLFNIMACKKERELFVSSDLLEYTLETAVKNDGQRYLMLYEQAKNSNIQTQRKEKIEQAAQILLETGEVIPILNKTNCYLLQDGIENYYVTAMGVSYFQKVKAVEKKIRVCLEGKISTFEPSLAESSLEKSLAANCFSGLCRESEAGEIELELAEAYEVSSDELSYRFVLREGLKWSDGQEITAQDIAYSWNHAIAAGILDGIEYVEKAIAEDEKTVNIILHQPYAYFLRLAAAPELGTVRQYSTYNTIGEYPVSGAYQPVKMEDGVLICEKNNVYWNAKQIDCECLEFFVDLEEDKAFNAFEKGELDLTEIMPVEQRWLACKESKFYSCKENWQIVCLGISWSGNLFSGLSKTQSRRLCNALGLLINRQYIALMTGRQIEMIATDIVEREDGQTDYYSEDIMDNYTMALDLLSMLNWDINEEKRLEQPRELIFGISKHSTSEQQLIVKCLQEDFGFVGIELKIKEYDTEQEAEQWMKEGKLDMVAYCLTSSYGDDLYILKPWVEQDGVSWLQWE